MGTTGTAAFVISEATCHSILSLPVNCPFNILSGERLCQFQDNLQLIKVIIIDEVSTLGKKYFISLTKAKARIRGNGRVIWCIWHHICW